LPLGWFSYTNSTSSSYFTSWFFEKKKKQVF
jgi:hypothetical protein